MGEQMDQCNGEQRPGAETLRRERESSQLRGGSGARHMVEQLLSARDHSDSDSESEYNSDNFFDNQSRISLIKKCFEMLLIFAFRQLS